MMIRVLILFCLVFFFISFLLFLQEFLGFVNALYGVYHEFLVILKRIWEIITSGFGPFF